MNIYYIIFFITFTLLSSNFARAKSGIDSNCNKFVKENKLINFSNSSKVYGTYKSRKKDYDYLKSKKYNISDYYHNLDGYTPTGNYDVDKYHALFDTERSYNWNNIKSTYKNTIENVNAEVSQHNYKSKYYDLNGNFRSTYNCANNSDCLAYKAYCSEEVAKKSITDKMNQYMRMNQHCLRGSKDISEYENFINTCDDVIKNLNFVKAQGNSLNKIAKTKNPEAKNFFNEVYHEFSEFKDDWDALKKDMQDKLTVFKKEQDKIAEEDLLKKELEHKNALLDPVRDEFLKCAGLSDARDKDVKGRNLADGVCKRLGDPVSPLSMEYQTIDFENEQVIDDLEKDMNDIQNYVIDDLAAEVSRKAFHESAMSVWAITNPTPKTSENAAAVVCKHTPKLCAMDDFKLILKDAFSEFQKKIKKNPLKVLNAANKEDVLKSDVLPLMNKMNAICSEYNKHMAKINYEKQKTYEDTRNRTVAVDNTYVHNQALINYEAEQSRNEFNSRQDGLMGKLLPLYDEVLNSELGYLFITDRFKKGIGTFSIDKMHEKCMSGSGNGNIFNSSNGGKELVSTSDLIVGDKQFKALVTDELNKIDKDYGEIRDLEENEVTNFLGADNTKKGEMLEQYLKTNPLTIIKMLQDNPSSDFAKALCSYILSIEDEDYRNRIRDWVLAGVGAVAGVALMFTGVGAPVGASLLALSIGATSLEVMNIIKDKNQHAKNAQYIEQAAATAQYELDMAINDALKEKKASEGTINDILWIAGPDLLGFGIGKIAKSMKLLKRGSSMTKLARLDNVIDVANDGRKIANATDEAQQVMRGLKRIQVLAGENYIKDASYFKNLTNEETLQLGALFSRLDDVQAAKLLKKFDEFENATEMKRFLTKLHVNVDEFIDAGNINLNKVLTEVESSKIRKLKSFEEINEEVTTVTKNISNQHRTVSNVGDVTKMAGKEVELVSKSGKVTKVSNLKVVETEPGMFDVVGDIVDNGSAISKKSLGGMSVKVQDDVLEINSALIKKSARGNGLQNDILLHITKSNPNITTIKSSKLMGVNEKLFMESLIQQYSKANNIPIEDFSKLKVTELNTKFSQCCSSWIDDLAQTDPTKYNKLLDEAFKNTPAYKSRVKLGFSEIDYDTLKITKSKNGTFSIENVIVNKPVKAFSVVSGKSTTKILKTLDEQVDYIVQEIPGLNKEQARLLIQQAHSRNSSVVFGGSRIRGDFKPGSDLDVGFGNLTSTQAGKIIKKADKIEGGLPIEKTKIVPGNETKSIPKIESPEEFFMRKGVRGKNDLRAGEEYIPSGSITIKPDGTIIKTIPIE